MKMFDSKEFKKLKGIIDYLDELPNAYNITPASITHTMNFLRAKEAATAYYYSCSRRIDVLSSLVLDMLHKFRDMDAYREDHNKYFRINRMLLTSRGANAFILETDEDKENFENEILEAENKFVYDVLDKPYASYDNWDDLNSYNDAQDLHYFIAFVATSSYYYKYLETVDCNVNDEIRTTGKKQCKIKVSEARDIKLKEAEKKIAEKLNNLKGGDNDGR